MKDDNFFELFGLKVQFEINGADLTARYRALQSQIHPDKYTNAAEKERLLSVHKAALVNEAYQVLKTPLPRAKYMLSLHGILLDEQQSTTLMAPDFLMEQMELREALSEIQHADSPIKLLDDIFSKIESKKNQLISDIALKLSKESKKEYEAAADKVRQLQFFIKLQEEARQIESQLDL